MSQRVLWINYKFSGSAAALHESLAPVVQPIADLPGMHWKIWLINEADTKRPVFICLRMRRQSRRFWLGRSWRQPPRIPP